MRNVDSWNVMKTWTLKTLNTMELQDADGWSGKLKYLVKTSWDFFPKAPASASLSAVWLLFPWDWASLCGKKHCCHTSWVLHPATSTMGDGFNYTFSGEKLKIAREEVLFHFVTSLLFSGEGRMELMMNMDIFRTTWFDWGRAFPKEWAKLIERGTGQIK